MRRPTRALGFNRLGQLLPSLPARTIPGTDGGHRDGEIARHMHVEKGDPMTDSLRVLTFNLLTLEFARAMSATSWSGGCCPSCALTWSHRRGHAQPRRRPGRGAPW
jgi:hypothetical protein